MYIIGIDIGTSATKTAVYDLDGALVAESTHEYPLSQPHNGWAEQNPIDWWEAVCATLRDVTAKINPALVVGVGFSGQMHGLVMLDENNKVVRPAIIWCDSRTGEECVEINQIVGLDTLMKITASPALTGFTASKIRWVQKHEPENYARCRHILLPKDYIRFMLSGEYHTDASDASGMQLLDIRTRSWSPLICEKLGVDMGLLAEVRESPEAVSRVSAKAAALTGLREGTILAAGAGDNAAAAVGTGVVAEGKAFTTIGTSGVVFAHVKAPAVDPMGRIHTFCAAVPGEYHTMGVTQAAGLSLQWFRNSIAPNTAYADLDKMAESLPIGAERLIYLPYLMGERTPHLNPDCRGVFFGLSAMHTTAHMYRAVLEGVAYSLNDAYELVSKTGTPITDMSICGGGAKSPLWRQMISDVYGISLTDMSKGGGASLGAAILGGVAGGAYPDVPSACARVIKGGSVTTPDKDRHEAYAKFFSLYRDLYASLADDYKKLSVL
ncbi:MAG: xylulokinase [Ruminococcaceae bacterium]|nr:xylulokinase [Oscillospiraceae bacterium]